MLASPQRLLFWASVTALSLNLVGRVYVLQRTRGSQWEHVAADKRSQFVWGALAFLLSPTLGMQQIEGTLHDSKAGARTVDGSGRYVLAARDDVARVAHTAYVSAVAEVTILWQSREQ